jgi:hypothetical protein
MIMVMNLNPVLQTEASSEFFQFNGTCKVKGRISEVAFYHLSPVTCSSSPGPFSIGWKERR